MSGKKRRHVKAPVVVPTPARAPRWAAGVLAVTLVTLVVVTITNLTLPRSYSIFAWDYASYFSVPVQLTFALVCAGLLFASYRWAPLMHLPCSAMYGIVGAGMALFWLSIFLCATPYPRIAGDGECGYDNILRTLRLPNYLARVLSNIKDPADVCATWIALEHAFALIYTGLSL
jgi:hypothetical protein